jgi:hypothetical protein
MAGVTRVNVRRSTGSYAEHNSPASYIRQLSRLRVHPRLPFGNYIHWDLSTTPVWEAEGVALLGRWIGGRETLGRVATGGPCMAVSCGTF